MSRLLARLLLVVATRLAGGCPCARCVRIDGNARQMATLRRPERRALGRELLRRTTRGGTPS